MRGGAGLATLAMVAGCARAPYTHRSQLILVSPEEETQLGAQAYQQVLAKSRLDSRPAVVAPVEAVGRRLAAAADQPRYQWRFAVIDDPKQQNAFALPGGKVAVYTGILPVAVDTNGLAVVLGHEIAHAIARHGAERMSQTMAAQAGQSVLGALFGGGPGTSDCCSWRERATTRTGRSSSGSACSSKPVRRARRSSLPRIRATARASSSSAPGFPKRCRTTRLLHARPSSRCPCTPPPPRADTHR